MKLYTIINPEKITNIYLITDDLKKEGLLIDPGSFALNVYSEIKHIGVNITKIMISNNDPFKISGIPVIKKIFDVTIYAHSSSEYNFDTVKVKHGDEIRLGNESGIIWETPIKTYDSLSLKFSNSLFVGNILQAGGLSSIDKTGVPSEFELGVIQKLFINLPENTVLYPEHGPATTIKIEKKFNPYFKKVNNE